MNSRGLGEPMPVVIRRFLAYGTTTEAIARRNCMSFEVARQIIAMVA